jgi:hypothetical protein
LIAYGDSTSTVDGTLTAGLKWAWEFENKKSNDPIQVIELCSAVDPVLSMLPDSKKYMIRFTPTNVNVYNGIPCEDKKGKTMINDQYLIKLVAGILKSGSKAEKSKEIVSLTSENILNLETICPGLSSPPGTADLLAHGIDKNNLPNPTTGRIETLSNIASSTNQLGIGAPQIAFKKLPYLSNMAAAAFFAPNNTAIFTRRFRMARGSHKLTKKTKRH